MKSEHTVVGEIFSPTPTAESLDALYACGAMLYERDDHRRAADVFRYLVLADPLRTDGWWALAACHEQCDDFEIAARLYEIGFRLGSESTELGLLCARARLRAGDPEGAREMLHELTPLIESDEEFARLRALQHEMEDAS